jgi:hypothetical protein
VAWRIVMGYLIFSLGLALTNAQLAPVAFANLNMAEMDGSPKEAPPIVIGFVGGFVRHDDMVHSGVQLAARLHAEYGPRVHVEVFENRRREEAHQDILRVLDTGHRGALSDEQKRNARIIIYGMSWGGSETVELARELEKDKIPVLLAITVDSVAKARQNNQLIPANVAEAANFYQTGGLLHGEPQIQAADPSRTKILGNFRYDYDDKNVQCENYPWWDRYLVRQHTEIECDPAVWNRVESLIRSKLPPPGQASAAQSDKH